MQPAMHQQVTSPPAAKTTDAVAPAPAVAAPRRRKSRRRRYIVIGIGALILLWIVGAVIASKREKPIPVTTEKAAKRTILQLVSATGKVQPETEVKISPEVAGEIIELPVIDGAQVNEGRLAGQGQTRFLQSLAGATGGGDQLGQSDESSTKGDDDEDGAGPQTCR